MFRIVEDPDGAKRTVDADSLQNGILNNALRLSPASIYPVKKKGTLAFVYRLKCGAVPRCVEISAIPTFRLRNRPA